MENNLSNKLEKLRNKDQQMRQFEMNKEMNEDAEKAHQSDRNHNVHKQPFSLMKSRLGFYSKGDERSPPVGAYNPRYEIILPRIPGYKIKKRTKRRRKPKVVETDYPEDHQESLISSMPNIREVNKNKRSTITNVEGSPRAKHSITEFTKRASLRSGYIFYEFKTF